MGDINILAPLTDKYVAEGNHADSDYFGLIREILQLAVDDVERKRLLAFAYELLFTEIVENRNVPTELINFGTSGWRGRLGKDINARSIIAVTRAILTMYKSVDGSAELQSLLGVKSFAEAKLKGCVLGFDNRFGGSYLAANVAATLTADGVNVFYAGESTTGVLSAAVLEKGAAFSVNLTPSHNPLEYGGFKFNAADAGPAASEVTERITREARRIVDEEYSQITPAALPGADILTYDLVTPLDSFACWRQRVVKNFAAHGLSLQETVADFAKNSDLVVAIDCVHGASRLHMRSFFEGFDSNRLIMLRDTSDFTFGGVAPEPSSRNLQNVIAVLNDRPEKFKIAAIIDPDGDRIRFTDGTTEISMNQFGAMAYHFLHEHKGKTGMVAKTVATSNLANAIAAQFQEELFEPPVGFKYFKEVFGKALVCFEESDGISIIGHTPEKDAYIGLLLALEMVLTTGMNLGDYLRSIEKTYGAFYPDRDGVEVTAKGKELEKLLSRLDKYVVGTCVKVGSEDLPIAEIIAVDGKKMIFEDRSWLMIRPSGTEPKVRFYVESRTPQGTKDLVAAAQGLLVEAGVL